MDPCCVADEDSVLAFGDDVCNVSVLLALCVAVSLCRCRYLCALALKLVGSNMRWFAVFLFILIIRFSHSCSYSGGVVMMMLLECCGDAQM